MTDQDTTHQMPVKRPPEPPRPRRLFRSRSDRMLAGVSGGLGDYFRVDPVIFRIGFGVTLFFGGLGALLYIALLIFVPSEQEGTPGTPGPRRSLWRIALIGAVAIAGLVGLSFMAIAAAWAAATGQGVLVALVVIAIGAALVAAAFKGGARWLILPALALAIPLGTVAAADIEFEGGVGKSTHRPQTLGAIPERGYELGIGEQQIDLRELAWHGRSVVQVKAEQGVGRMLVAVPEHVCVDADADADYGVVEVGGSETTESLRADYAATPRLELKAHIDAGKIEVVNDDDADLDHDRFERNDISSDELSDRMEAACSGSTRTAKADES